LPKRSKQKYFESPTHDDGASNGNGIAHYEREGA